MTRTLRHIGWCPVCQRDIKVRNGRLVHHGYERPGIGFIVGDCFGVGYPPYEMSTECCDAYLDLYVLEEVRRAQNELRVLRSPGGPERLLFPHYDIATRRFKQDPHTGTTAKVWLSSEEAAALQAQADYYARDYFSWDKQLQKAITSVEQKLAFWEHEQARTEKLIAAWRQQPLRTIEEEAQKKEQTRKERDESRARARAAKVAVEVAKVQKRIDSAVKNKNSAALADIFTSTKIRELSNYELSKEEALVLLARDDIWVAFGLLTPHGYLLGPKREEILNAMTWGHRVPSTRYSGGFDRVPMPWPDALGGGKAKTRR